MARRMWLDLLRVRALYLRKKPSGLTNTIVEFGVVAGNDIAAPQVSALEMQRSFCRHEGSRIAGRCHQRWQRKGRYRK